MLVRCMMNEKIRNKMEAALVCRASVQRLRPPNCYFQAWSGGINAHEKGEGLAGPRLSEFRDGPKW